MNHDNTVTLINYRILKKDAKKSMWDAYVPSDTSIAYFNLEIYHPLYQPLRQPLYDNGQPGYQPEPYNP